LLAATEFAVRTLRGVADRDWSVRAGSLDWDVSFTVAHVAGAITKYTTYLAATATRWSPLIVSRDPRATNDQLLDGVDISARGLAFVASHVDAAARGFHAWGMSDASSSLARAANEVLVHGWDAATGLGIAFDPPPSVCSPVLRRRHPWVDADTEPWATLLAANGRTGGPNRIALEMPLDEWDGNPPSGGPQPPAIAWEWDATTARWTPTYL
jgi:uncharacterized protein (TIGR03083 family)